MSRRRRRRVGRAEAPSEHGARQCARNVGHLFTCLADSLEEDGLFIGDLLRGCAECVSFAPQLRKAYAMTEAQAEAWRDLARQLDAHASRSIGARSIRPS